MELMLTPYPASVRDREGICRGRLCPAFETEGSPLLETAAKMLENARTPGAGRDIPVALASAPGADPVIAFILNPKVSLTVIRKLKRMY